MTRDEVLDVLERVIPLKRKKIDRNDIPVLFMRDRIAVIMPADRFTVDQHIKLEGKFQAIMTYEKRAHAFIDFAEDWRGIDTPMTGGFS